MKKPQTYGIFLLDPLQLGNNGRPNTKRWASSLGHKVECVNFNTFLKVFRCISISLKLSYHLSCWGKFNDPLSPTCFYSICMWMSTPLWSLGKNNLLCFNKIWEDLVVTKWEIPMLGQLVKILFCKFGGHDIWGSEIKEFTYI